MFHNFTPIFVGFAGKYCRNDILPLNLITCGTVRTNRKGLPKQLLAKAAKT
jgi:hypothetical protein